MYKLEPFVSEKIWGYERWIVSTHKAGQSIVSAEHQKLGDFIGGEFPLLIKVIQADSTLSVQVHPDDEYAKVHENSLGKTECWYVLDALPGATLVCGLNKNYSTDELRKAIKDNTLEGCLRNVSVEKGDFIFIPSGTVHAINGGLRLLEVQEPSDITYRLYDWGRGRELHIEKGLEVTKADAPDPVRSFNGEFSCDFFKLKKINIEKEAEIELTPERATTVSENAYSAIFVLSGSGSINSTPVTAEDTFLVQKGEKLSVKGDMSLMLMEK